MLFAIAGGIMFGSIGPPVIIGIENREEFGAVIMCKLSPDAFNASAS
jgi:hypothetical protein